MTRTIFLFILFYSVNTMYAQQPASVPGEYYLRGVMETASGFLFKPDSTFEFFFSQGALDRTGSGRWTVKNGKLILNSSRPRPPKNFALITSKTIPGNNTIIKITDKNTVLQYYVDVAIGTGDKILNQSTNHDGEVRFDKQPVKVISLLFRLCPERASEFTVDTKDHNYFEFRFEPWIAEVFFENFSLIPEANQLTGAHPLLEGNQFRYEKSK